MHRSLVTTDWVTPHSGLSAASAGQGHTLVTSLRHNIDTKGHSQHSSPALHALCKYTIIREIHLFC